MIPKIELPSVLVPVFLGDWRYRCAWGGRGSGKTRSFAKMIAARAIQLSKAGKTGLIVCAREIMTSIEDSSMAEIKIAIKSEPWMLSYFDIGESYIKTKDGNIEFAFVGLLRNLDAIKSKANIHIFWIDEAEPISETAWQKLIPTVREHNSEVWVTWNPEHPNSAVHKRFRKNPPKSAIVVECNYTDNPWFPDVLDEDRKEDLEHRPEQHDHVWNGRMKSYVEGAYFAEHLLKCKQEKRIGRIGKDPNMTTYAVFDIGGTGAKADAVAIWICQFVGHEIRVLDYYEAVGQPLAVHLAWLRKNGYENAQIVLPHDGEQNDKVYDVSYESACKAAQFSVRVIPNQGKGAAMMRIEAVRRIFPLVWFNRKTTKAGRTALGWYHEKKDEKRDIGLGPNHDWSSHGSDAFGLMAVIYKPPEKKFIYEAPDQSWVV